MNTQEIREQIEGLHDIADEQVLPEHYQLHKTADSMKSMQARIELLEKVVEAGKYLSAEVRNAWASGRISIDTHDAAGLFDNSIAALKEQTDA